jgi:general L-amino acid transport system permease protein
MSDITETRLPAAKPSRGSLLTDPRTRSILIQGTVLVLVCVALWFFISNGRANLAARNIQTGFGFLDQQAGFDISQTLVAYSDNASYGRVFLIGLLNTLLVAGLGVIFATIIGFGVGIARLSPNWLVSKLAEV